jgi:hypothetical protein
MADYWHGAIDGLNDAKEEGDWSGAAQFFIDRLRSAGGWPDEDIDAFARALAIETRPLRRALEADGSRD